MTCQGVVCFTGVSGDDKPNLSTLDARRDQSSAIHLLIVAHRQSIADTRSVGEVVRDHVLLERSSEQMRPWATGVDRHVLSSMSLTVPVHHRGELKVPCAGVHCGGILPSAALLDVTIVGGSIGVAQCE